ncbi:MAG TPA: NrfD/PsrC family molybdoenzyme membrane anchor subunit [Actinomycetes bacterium]|nr:NrfD/PsrC family molybdoenzyme membrane anchor subunit [Actinomycetes bacterium]
MSRPGGDGDRPVAPVPPAAEVRSYYGRPVLKSPVWSDEIPAYYFAGGLAGASASLALGARLTGNDRLARSALTAAAAGVTASLPLLVGDLGRPERFHHMLRVLRPTSPMSVGTWLLLGLGPAAVAAAACDRLGILPRLGRVAEAVAGTLGPAVSTYTAVLVANTAVPVWHEAGRELPMVFAAGAAASAGGAAAVLTPAAAATPARRLAVGAALVELLAAEAMERRLGELAGPYHEGPARRPARLARLCSAGGALLLATLGRRRPAAVAGGLLTMAGAAFQRFAVHKAGFASAADPRYVVEPQRRRLAADHAADRL